MGRGTGIPITEQTLETRGGGFGVDGRSLLLDGKRVLGYVVQEEDGDTGIYTKQGQSMGRGPSAEEAAQDLATRGIELNHREDPGSGVACWEVVAELRGGVRRFQASANTLKLADEDQVLARVRTEVYAEAVAEAYKHKLAEKPDLLTDTEDRTTTIQIRYIELETPDWIRETLLGPGSEPKFQPDIVSDESTWPPSSPDKILHG